MWGIRIGIDGPRIDKEFESRDEADRWLNILFGEEVDHDQTWIKFSHGYQRLSSIDRFTIHEYPNPD